MQFKTVSFKFGMTQNLGDYTNTRPEVELVAELDEGDDIGQALSELANLAVSAVHGLVDDELEFAGKEIKYSTQPLYQVRWSKLRQCVVIFPVGLDLPIERTWKEADSWNSAGYGYPRHMRRETAEKAAAECREEGFSLVFVGHGTQFQFANLPPLPDPGPEPMWHIKNLADGFRRLQLHNDALWEELAQLEHVTAEYLRALYNADAERRNSTNELIAIIRNNKPWPPTTEVAADDEWDEDEDEDDDEV